MNPHKKGKKKSRKPRVKPDITKMRKLTTWEIWEGHCYSSTGKHQATAKGCPHRYLHPNPNKLGSFISYCKLPKCVRIKETEKVKQEGEGVRY